MILRNYPRNDELKLQRGKKRNLSRCERKDVQEREKAQQYQQGKQSTNNEVLEVKKGNRDAADTSNQDDQRDGAVATDCVEDDELHSQEAESPRGVGAAGSSQDDELNVHGVGRDENDEAGWNAYDEVGSSEDDEPRRAGKIVCYCIK
ncbi:hypothetical protein TSAR_012877 [Trichomalopsis sarcophagae]|uniref:Uncharacterized protein n=1 Tax=Trichomalopsis sarcophagae TaxID=543379 RepID=A0A232EPP7_9HYME|nr:hypothetical protein TSAR_012877 [Trichomalopsis sarcophagae]